MRARISVEYVAQVHWSLLKSGVPLFARFVVHEIDGPGEPVTLRLGLEDLLDETRIEIVPDRDLGQNLVGKIESLLRSRWMWGFAWQVAQPRPAELRLTLDGLRIACPVTLLPPGAWYRAASELDQQLKTFSLDDQWLELGEPALVQPDFVPGRIGWRGRQPPLEACVAALINPNDRDSRPDGALGREVIARVLMRRGLDPRTAEPLTGCGAAEALSAYYEVIRERRLVFADFQKEFVRSIQSVRLLPHDRERGAVCLDLVCRGCEVLEAMGLGPVFLLTHGGGHVALGCWDERSGSFPDLQPVCTDPGEIAARVQGESAACRLLDVSLALLDVPLDEAVQHSSWQQLGRGFVHAVDLRACRSWKVERTRFSIWPLDRYPAPAWIERYLNRLLEELETPVPEVVYLPQDKYESFLAEARLPAIPDDFLIRDEGGVLIRLQQLARMREELSPVVEALRTTALADIFLHDPAGFFVPLHASWLAGLPFEAEPELAAALARPGAAIALRAHGGGGKTYLCERLACQLARESLAHPAEHPVVPVFLRLRYLTSADQDLLAVIAREIRCEESDLRAATQRYRLVFLLDSLEESEFSRRNHTPDSYQALFHTLLTLKNSSVLLTFRPTLFGDAPSYLPDFQLADLAGWTDAEIGMFFRRCNEEKGIVFSRGWEHFHRTVLGQPRLSELARTPLFARMMVVTRQILASDTSIVGSAADLYGHYTWECFGRRAHKVEIPVARSATERIAGLSYERQRESLTGDEIANTLADFKRERGIGFWRDFLARDVVIHGLLVPDSQEENGRRVERFRFSHLSFAHFFLAAWLTQPWRAAPEFLTSLFGRASLPDGAIDFLAELLKREPDRLQSLSARLRRARPPRGSLSRALPEDIAFRNLLLVGLRCRLDLTGTDLGDLDGAASLARVDLTGARLSGTDLSGSNLQTSILRQADLRRCMLHGADLSGADLTETRLEEADLSRCRLSRIQGLPWLCGAHNLDRIRLADDDHATLDLLLTALERCPAVDPESAVWQRRAREALTERRLNLSR